MLRSRACGLLLLSLGCNSVLGNEEPVLRGAANSGANEDGEGGHTSSDGGASNGSSSAGGSFGGSTNSDIPCVSECAETILAEDETDIDQVLVDTEGLYWVSRAPGMTSMRHMTLVDREVSTFVDSNVLGTVKPILAQNSESVFWSRSLSFGSVNKMSGTAASLSGASDYIHFFAVDEATLIWGEGSSADPTLYRQALSEIEKTVLNDTIDGITTLAVNDSTVYFTGNQRVYRQPLNGGDAHELYKYDTSFTPQGIACDGDRVFWIDVAEGSGAIVSQSLEEGASPVVLVQGQARPHALVLDADFVYFTTEGNGVDDGTVMRVPKDGSEAATPLVIHALSPGSLAVDATYVYWASRGDDTLRRIAKH